MNKQRWFSSEMVSKNQIQTKEYVFLFHSKYKSLLSKETKAKDICLSGLCSFISNQYACDSSRICRLSFTFFLLINYFLVTLH